jgi:hypothetical protein
MRRRGANQAAQRAHMGSWRHNVCWNSPCLTPGVPSPFGGNYGGCDMLKMSAMAGTAPEECGGCGGHLLHLAYVYDPADVFVIAEQSMSIWDGSTCGGDFVACADSVCAGLCCRG